LADRYTIERELGRGGMAIVYLAKHLRHDRVVALKALRSELAATTALGGSARGRGSCGATPMKRSGWPAT